jgi:hypothetical protein
VKIFQNAKKIKIKREYFVAIFTFFLKESQKIQNVLPLLDFDFNLGSSF